MSRGGIPPRVRGKKRQLNSDQLVVGAGNTADTGATLLHPATRPIQTPLHLFSFSPCPPFIFSVFLTVWTQRGHNKHTVAMVTFHSPSAPLLRRRTSSGPQVLLNASWLLMTSIKQKKTAVGFFLGGVFSFHCNLFHFGGEENLQKNGFIIVHCQVLQNVPPLGAETLMFSLLRQAVSV